MLQYELTNKLGWEPLAMYHKTEARVTLAYLLGDIGYDVYQKLAIKNKEYFDTVLSEVNTGAPEEKQLPEERKTDMERVGMMIYEESVRIADEAKAARNGKKPT